MPTNISDNLVANLLVIAYGIESQQPITMQYDNGNTTERNIIIHSMNKKKNLVIQCTDIDKNEPRSFRVDSIQKMTI